MALVALMAACTPGAGRRSGSGADGTGLMTAQELQAIASRAPDASVVYGPDPNQKGELRVPPWSGPHPVVVLIHGGCFKSAYSTLSDLGPLGDALRDSGIASWNIEYRALDQPGGGWPETYLDIGRAVDHLRDLAGPYHLDLTRVAVVGHSAGGHLAMWAASRRRLPAASPLRVADALPVRGVVDLAGLVDLTASLAEYETLCSDRVITGLMGGTPAEVPDRYADASAASRLPLGVAQVLVIGEWEEFLPRPIAEAYVRTASAAGDPIRLSVIPAVGHFEIASPREPAWTRVLSAIGAVLDGRLPAE